MLPHLLGGMNIQRSFLATQALIVWSLEIFCMLSLVFYKGFFCAFFTKIGTTVCSACLLAVLFSVGTAAIESLDAKIVSDTCNTLWR